MKLIDVAVFTFPSQAAILESILQEEGIEYTLNNPNSAIIAPGSGARLSVKEQDANQVVQIIKEAGFEASLLPQ